MRTAQLQRHLRKMAEIAYQRTRRRMARKHNQEEFLKNLKEKLGEVGFAEYMKNKKAKRKFRMKKKRKNR